MLYFHPTDKAKEFANSALQRIEAEGLLPTPENYELWFVYYSGANPELVRVIDLMFTETGQKVTDGHCYEIFQKFLSGNREGDQVRRAGDQIQKTIEEVNGAVSSVREFTSEYGKTLADVNDQLKEEKTRDEVNQLLNNVLSDTRTMIDQNHYLEKLLKESADTMETLKRDLEVARKEAMTDALTGLNNRKGFDLGVKKILSEVDSGHSEGFCLILLDIDHFKDFNDTFGHQVGDQVLRLVARTLKEGVKGRDMAARYGGEEFAILLPDTKLQSGVKVGEILREAVAKKEVINRTTGKQIARITLSAGVAEYAKGMSVDDLITAADSALYAAKKGGRNQVMAAAAGMTKRKA